MCEAGRVRTTGLASADEVGSSGRHTDRAYLEEDVVVCGVGPQADLERLHQVDRVGRIICSNCSGVEVECARRDIDSNGRLLAKGLYRMHNAAGSRHVEHFAFSVERSRGEGWGLEALGIVRQLHALPLAQGGVLYSRVLHCFCSIVLR